MTVHRDKLLIKKIDALISQIYSWNEILNVSDSSSVHHQEFFTVHTAMLCQRFCRWPTTSWVHYTTSCNTQSSSSEDGRNYRPKHVELIGIINKPLLLHLVGCLYYLYQ